MSSDFYIPTTISEKAQNFCKIFSRKDRDKNITPPANDIDAWEKYNNNFLSLSKENNEIVVKKFKPILKNLNLNGVPAVEITPAGWKANGKIIIYIHGGAYTLSSSEASLVNSAPLAHKTKTRIISIDYSLAPKAKWRTVISEVITAIKEIYKNYKPASVGIYGDSAGGGLAASAILKMRDDGIEMPAAVALWSPWSDITETGDTYHTLKDNEPAFLYKAGLEFCANSYADPEDQKNPYVSPVYGDFTKGFPPTLIQGGTKEILLSNCVRLYQKIDQAGVEVKLDIYEGMWHVFQSCYYLPEAKVAIKKTAAFLNKNLLRKIKLFR
ncbi:MAG: alpha/beta hydrolase [Chlamydiae bacterium]|nr:MAG: alpha/beta hydrolase [Chlamydiota bacterium]